MHSSLPFPLHISHIFHQILKRHNSSFFFQSEREFDADDSLSASRFVDAQRTTRNCPSTIAHSESVDDVIVEITVIVVVRSDYGSIDQ